MTRARWAIFIWATVFALRVDGSLIGAPMFGVFCVYVLEAAVDSWRSVQRTWRERHR